MELIGGRPPRWRGCTPRAIRHSPGLARRRASRNSISSTAAARAGRRDPRACGERPPLPTVIRDPARSGARQAASGIDLLEPTRYTFKPVSSSRFVPVRAWLISGRRSGLARCPHSHEKTRVVIEPAPLGGPALRVAASAKDKGSRRRDAPRVQWRNTAWPVVVADRHAVRRCVPCPVQGGNRFLHSAASKRQRRREPQASMPDRGGPRKGNDKNRN